MNAQTQAFAAIKDSRISIRARRVVGSSCRGSMLGSRRQLHRLIAIMAIAKGHLRIVAAAVTAP